jgi:hypothetical protein
MIVDSIVKYSNSDDQHHYWFNTFEHGVDMDRLDTNPSNDSASVLGLVPYLYKHYGPAGDNTIWVETSEKIFSYIITQRHSLLSAASITPYTGSMTRYAVADGKKLAGVSITKCVRTNREITVGMSVYDLRGQATRSGNIIGHGLYIVKR